MSKNDVNNLRVVVGDQDIKNSFDTQSAKTYTVKRVVRHKNFDINTLFHDVAILSLGQDINYDYSVQSICLNRQPNHDFTGTYVQVAGWGATSAGSSTSSTLRKVDVRVWSNTKCADRQHYGQTSSKITGNQICAATPESSKDSCSVRVFNLSSVYVYRVTEQLVQNLPLTSKQKLRFGLACPSLARPRRNLCFEVNRRFCTSCSVTLYTHYDM